MQVSLFDFDLPQEAIALRPAQPRDSARLLVVPANGEPLRDAEISELPAYLRPGDALVVNDTRVIHARLAGMRFRGVTAARMEATLIERLSQNRWRALARPAKRLSIGERLRFQSMSEDGTAHDTPARKSCAAPPLEATIVDKGESGVLTLDFDLSGAALDDAIESLGSLPLPPYIAGKRSADARDESDYQTLFAKEAGAVAAPTAGLHFTPALRAAAEAAGATFHSVTLHVGAGTFLPVKVEDTNAHEMHSEWCALDEETAQALNAARRRGGRIVAIGTTALRCLESAAGEDGELRAYRDKTRIFITPGYRFRAVDALLTNFHLPRSTLFMLVSAFSGLSRMKEAYAHALASGYRFYSYGDACLLLRDCA